MAHNPVLEKSTLTPSLFRSRMNIPIGAVGVLYEGGRYVRTLEAGESLGLGERSKTLTLYVVDTQPHTAVWSVGLPTLGDEDLFSVSIAFEYRVVDPPWMIQNRVQDTETLLSRALEPTLRREARRFPLNRYRQAETELETAIRSFPLADMGLELLSADVTMNLDTAARERIRQIDDLERAVRVPQLTEHNARLPTREPAYEFETQVALTYRVTNRDRLPTRTLQEAEEWLWRQVQRALRRVSRRYTVDQVDQAEEAMQTAIEEEHFSDHGLEMVSAVVEISLDERAQARARTLVEIGTREEFERAQASLEDWKKKRALDQQRDAIDFYGPLIQQGQWSLLAMIMSQDPSGAQRILEYLDDQRRETLSHQMSIFKTMVEAGGLEGWQMEDHTKVILQSVLDQALKMPARPGLAEAPAPKQIEVGTGERAEIEQKAPPPPEDFKAKLADQAVPETAESLPGETEPGPASDG